MNLIFDAARMQRLAPGAVRYLVVHTAGAPGAVDQSAAAIHAYHRTPASKGGPPDGPWAGIGYHWVIRKSGAVEDGRSREYVGSHVGGLNSASLGIACSGNGDLEPFTPAQMESLGRLLARLQREHDVPLDRVIGHREAYLIPGVENTRKSCPGRLVDMEEVRNHVLRAQLAMWPAPPPRLIGGGRP